MSTCTSASGGAPARRPLLQRRAAQRRQRRLRPAWPASNLLWPSSRRKTTRSRCAHRARKA
eukprot:13950774-Alexandrium_andersonii.AAC.1